MLDEAEEIVNAAGPAVLAEVELQRRRRARWRRIFGRVGHLRTAPTDARISVRRVSPSS